MYLEFDFTQAGLMWFSQNRLAAMQDGYDGVLDAMAGHFGDKTIVNGVNENNGTVSDGWISYNGEILPFTGGSVAQYVDVQETITTIPFNDGTSKPVLKTRRLVMVSISTGTSFLYSELVRPGQYKDVWVKDDIKQHKCNAAYITANFDPTNWHALPTSQHRGWKIDLDAGGRVIMGWHPSNTDPGNDAAWSVDANIIGRKFGEQLHQLTIEELAKHNHIYAADDQVIDANKPQIPVRRVAGQSFAHDWSASNGGNGGYFLTTDTGGDQKHNNIQPVIVYLTLVKL